MFCDEVACLQYLSFIQRLTVFLGHPIYSFIPWGWGVNGAFSVVGSLTALVIAINFDLKTTLLCGAFAYGLAMMSIGTLEKHK
ncbi:hypothetical protein BH10PSE19_BH10PSE19_04900 [soil metagenome]